MTTGDTREDALDRLRTRLHQLYRANGEPSSRDVAQRTRKAISHTKVLEIIRCADTPKWNQLLLVVDALGGDPEEFRALWVAVRECEDPVAGSSDRYRDALVNVARRHQALVDELVSHVAYLRRGDQDTVPVENLRVVERLAMRMRRIDENLLLLTGVDLSRSGREPVSLADTVGAAWAELTSYRRIEIGQLDPTIKIVPVAAYPLRRLLTELLDNALTFSSPESVVTVTVDAVGPGILLRIADDGIGISSATIAEFVDQLDRPRPAGVVRSRMMGLSVVARLARDLRIDVTLAQGAVCGSVASLSIPPAIVVSELPSGSVRSERIPDQSHRAMLATLPREHRNTLVDLLPSDQVRRVYAGLGADGAQAVLDETRPANWPMARQPPIRRPRPGFHDPDQ